MKKFFLVYNIIFALLILIFDIIYMNVGGLFLKGFTSSLFVLLGLGNLIYAIKTKNDVKFPIIMTIALIFAMIGDIVLNIHFISGALIFAIGHIFYFISYIRFIPIKKTDLIVSWIIFLISASVIIFVPLFEFEGIMQYICLFYALIISLMLGKAISNLINEPKKIYLIIAIGSFLFFFSDLMLLFHVFSNVSKVFDDLCLITYYPAQAILASTIYLNIRLND